MKYFITRHTNPIQNTTNVFDDFFRPFSFRTSHFMKTDISEVEGNYKLEIEMPGFDKKDINLELNDGYLTVSATSSQKEESQFLTKERKNSMSRSYYVGETSHEEIKAKYENGILTITYPKEPEKVEATKILID